MKGGVGGGEEGGGGGGGMSMSMGIDLYCYEELVGEGGVYSLRTRWRWIVGAIVFIRLAT